LYRGDHRITRSTIGTPCGKGQNPRILGTPLLIPDADT